jgi:hypothetical protein
MVDIDYHVAPSRPCIASSTPDSILDVNQTFNFWISKCER